MCLLKAKTAIASFPNRAGDAQTTAARATPSEISHPKSLHLASAKPRKQVFKHPQSTSPGWPLVACKMPRRHRKPHATQRPKNPLTKNPSNLNTNTNMATYALPQSHREVCCFRLPVNANSPDDGDVPRRLGPPGR